MKFSRVGQLQCFEHNFMNIFPVTCSLPFLLHNFLSNMITNLQHTDLRPQISCLTENNICYNSTEVSTNRVGSSWLYEFRECLTGAGAGWGVGANRWRPLLAGAGAGAGWGVGASRCLPLLAGAGAGAGCGVGANRCLPLLAGACK